MKFRCFVARRVLSWIYALFGVLFPGLNMRWRTKNDKYQVCPGLKESNRCADVVHVTRRPLLRDRDLSDCKFSLYRVVLCTIAKTKCAIESDDPLLSSLAPTLSAICQNPQNKVTSQWKLADDQKRAFMLDVHGFSYCLFVLFCLFAPICKAQ